MGTQQLNNYTFNDTNIRILQQGDELWFLAADVIKELGHSNLSKALQNLTEGDVQNYRVHGTRGRMNKIISEGGLYKLIMRSNLKSAHDFQHWVANVVLPSIRKDGGYITGEEKVASGDMSEDELILRAMEVMQGKVARLTSERDALKEELTLLTIAEYTALNHVYFSQSQKARLSAHTKKLMSNAGEVITKSPRTVAVRGKMYDTHVNVYTRDKLDQAAADLCLFNEVKASPRPLVN